MIDKKIFHDELKKNKVYRQIYNCTACGSCVSDSPNFEKCSLKTIYKGEEANVKGLLWILQDIAEDKIDISINVVEFLFRCSTCNYCQLFCPMLEPLTVILLLRKKIVDTGMVPKTTKRLLENVYKYGNVFGKAQKDRANWAKGLSINYISEMKNCEFLLFLDCSSAYVARNQNIARKLSVILNLAGIKYCCLGKEEKCDGNEILNMGEEALFEKLAKENISIFKKYAVKKILTISPHSFHVLKNIYIKLDPAFDIQILHYTHILRKLISNKKLKLSKINKKITYHDPCYLGRHNFIWEEPREILKNISKEEIVEMDYNKKKSICCGGGGGCLWMERGNGVIMEQVRLKQAMELKVDVIASACPFCIQQLESAREELNAKIEVKDIIELVYEAVCSS